MLKVIQYLFVPVFVLLYLLQLVTATSGTCVVDNSNESPHLPSLYQQYCCVDYNRGKNIIVTADNINTHLVLCPLKIPASCSTTSFLPSCSAILTSHPTAISGYYNIMLANGTVITEYCDMEGVHCDGEGGWMRVAYLNMSDPSEDCPPEFRLYEENSTRACGSNTSGCQSVQFSTNGISYSQVCGRVTGYQKGSPDAININLGSLQSHNDINQEYVDGVSITRGNPRHHVWTFMAATQENTFLDKGQYVCPCAPDRPLAVTPQLFIGNDYFCESGNPGGLDLTTFFTNDPLWDGKQCGLIEEACCNVTGIPWFNKVLQQPTTDYIELRVCIDQAITDEVSLVSRYDIYIK